MRNEGQTSVGEEKDITDDVLVFHNSNNVVEENIDELAAFLYHLYREKQG